MTEPVDPSQSLWAPQPDGAAPQPLYRAPQPPYQAPHPSHQAPQPSYEAPQPRYEPPGQLGYTPQPDPTYPGQPYGAQYVAGQPAYPNAGYPAQGYAPYGEYLPPSEPPRRRRGLIIALVAVVVVAAGGIAAVLVAGGSSTSTASKGPLPLPSTLGSFNRVTDASTDQLRTEMQSFLGSGEAGKLFTKGALGVYGTPAGNADAKIILLAARSSDFPSLTSGSLSASMFGSGNQFQSFPAGANGGTVECFDANIGAIDETECIWADKTSLGFLVSVNTDQVLSDVSALVNTARDTIDH